MAKDKILVINTSESDRIFIGIVKDNFFIDKLSKKTNYNHSEKLISMIEKLLDKNKLEPKDLKAVAVFRGPGSYTGLKIGATIASVMAWSLDISVIGIDGKEINLENLKQEIKKAGAKFTEIVEPDYSEQAYYE